MNKIISMAEAADMIKDGMTIMISGFLSSGSPEKLIDEIVKKGVRDLTLICNDTSYPDRGVGKMVVAKQFKAINVTHIGTNPETIRQTNAGELGLTLIPQGTILERMRCGGTGLGGVLTPTGIGTEVENGKEKINVNGRDYLLELPLRADIALIYGTYVDKSGNVRYTYTQQNYNPVMAMAADVVICEAENIVEVGEIDQHDVMTQGILVDYIVGRHA